jgi:hypothetical protein
MHESRTFILVGSVLILLGLVLFMQPQYLANPRVLGAIIVAQVLVLSLCKYKESFFVVLMAAFLWAGIDLPLGNSWLQGRWIVLAVGALAGLAIYMRDGNHRFSLIHLLAFSCVLSAIVSASVSAYPQEALLKSLSLFLLFLYGVTGARLAVPVLEPERFFRKLLLGCEVITYIAAIAYFLVRWPIFGNPNSLGAVMGIVAVPVILWGFLCAEGLGCVYLEAMACAKPAIGCWGQGIEEILEHGKTGILIAPGNEGELSDSLRALLHDSSLRQRLGVAAREAVIARLTLDHQARQLAEIYRGCAA